MAPQRRRCHTTRVPRCTARAGDHVDLQVTALEEHDTVPWEALPGQMEQLPEVFGEWRVADRPPRLPHSYTLQAVKPT